MRRPSSSAANGFAGPKSALRTPPHGATASGPALPPTSAAPGDVTLRRFISHVPGPRASALRQLRDRVASAVDAFRVQHLKTATLLVEFARANHAVLSGLLRQGGDARTYRTDGTAPWWTERGLLDARR